MRVAAVSFLAGVAVAWGTIIAAGGAGMFLGGAVVATIAMVAALVGSIVSHWLLSVNP